jgi:hypothetical protein
MAGASGGEEADAQLGGSDNEDGDPQELVGSGCGTPGTVNGATGSGLSGTLRAWMDQRPPKWPNTNALHQLLRASTSTIDIT